MFIFATYELPLAAGCITLLAFFWEAAGKGVRAAPPWPHPVRLIGRLIAFGEGPARAWAGVSSARLYLAGAVLSLTTAAATMAAAAFILRLGGGLFPFRIFIPGLGDELSPFRIFISLYLVYAVLCLGELTERTWRVELELRNGSLEKARQALALLVGRDTAGLSEAGTRRALIETLAENLSDGVVAPLFYLALGGPVLAWGFKAVNTLDSMIGYKNERYLHLGRFAAKLDDAAGFIPARLSAVLLVWAARLSGRGDWRAARRIARRDGLLHPSPNAGQPEAAMAGALGLWLGGPSTYGGKISDKPKLNAGGGEPRPEHMEAAERLTAGASALMLGLTLLIIIFLAGRLGW